MLNHLSGCYCMWKAVLPPSYLRAATEVVKILLKIFFCTTSESDAKHLINIMIYNAKLLIIALILQIFQS